MGLKRKKEPKIQQLWNVEFSHSHYVNVCEDDDDDDEADEVWDYVVWEIKIGFSNTKTED